MEYYSYFKKCNLKICRKIDNHKMYNIKQGHTLS